MDAERWRRIDGLFAAALDRPPDERASLLAERCGADQDLHDAVERLLELDARAASFLERPAADLVGSDDDEATMVEAPLERIGPYRLIRLIRHGGMGSVYLARRDAAYHQEVAVKFARHGFENDEVRLRFHSERQILARLAHPNIARLFDGGTTRDGRPYLVMEYIEGLPIDRYCDQNRLSIHQRLQLFRAVCSAVEHAHRNLLVHRDVKPSNILVRADGTPMLLDFGIAKVLEPGRFDPQAASTATGRRPMTPSYASPEQIRGLPITTASDVYSLGVLLYRLLTGRSPYRRESPLPHEIERLIVEQEPERPSRAVLLEPDDSAERDALSVAELRGARPRELRRILSGDLDTIVAMALRKRPERRYGSAQELSDDVRRHLDHQPVVARPDTAGYRLGKFVRRNALAVAGGTLVATLLVALVVLSGWQSSRLASQRDIAERERAKAEQTLDFVSEIFESVDTAPRGSLTVREALDRGLEKIEQLDAQPEVRASLMHVIGKVYRRLGVYDQAKRLLERATEARRQVYGEEHLAVAQSLNELADLEREIGHHDSAEAHLRQALAIRRKLLPGADVKIAESLNDLAALVAKKGHYDEAERLFRESIAMVGALLGEDHPDTALASNNLAELLRLKGDSAASEALFRESIAVFRRRLGNEHPRLAVSLGSLARLLLESGNHEEAEPLLREALAIRRRLYGDEHRGVVLILNDLARLLSDRGELEAAKPLFEEALVSSRNLFGDRHPYLAACMSGLALVQERRGDLRSAESLYREALAMLRELYPDGHPHLVSVQGNLANLLAKKGDLEGAELNSSAAVTLARRLTGDDHPSVASLLIDRARILLASDTVEEAEATVRRAIEILEKKLPQGHWKIAHARSVLGDCRTREGRYRDAEILLLESQVALAGRFGPRAPWNRQALERLVRHYEARDLADRAARYRALLHAGTGDE